ncbi:group 1 glycosyl transferase [Oceanococcus atlanticus]|uniref:Group 1 glycosyl transferase n=1 Tax=Oceanococcus atlanticus TaxID=1317117 RepID=A0A1Y1SIW3_9GAMM|nr:glycosyltransferase [Oceanococcus atlanticus]ORE89221.1 group 1 glycosyl transferase [Oceanococcus atlanticus]
MRIVFFGSAESSPRYARTQQVVARMRELGVDVHNQLRERAASSSARVGAFRNPFVAIRLMLDMLASWGAGGWAARRLRPDLLWIGYPALLDIMPALILRRLYGSRVIYDAMICLTETVVEDRKLLKRGGRLHRLLFRLERFLLRRADCLVVDTEQNRALLCDKFEVDCDRVFVLPISIDETVWAASPVRADRDVLRVAFWGTFVPLHGAKVIAEAVNLVVERCPSQVVFRVVGDGQDADAFAAALSAQAMQAVQWDRSIQTEEQLKGLAAWADICLGIFGTSAKTQCVVPYKVIHALASGREVITADSPAVRGFQHSVALERVPAGSAAALADAIEQRANAPQRDNSALARELFESNFSAKAQLRLIKELLEK